MAEITKVSSYQLKLLGIALYWAEGGKRGKRFEFTNANPLVIRVIINFLNQICSKKVTIIKAQLNIHQGISTKRLKIIGTK